MYPPLPALLEFPGISSKLMMTFIPHRLAAKRRITHTDQLPSRTYTYLYRLLYSIGYYIV
jgi:hypothetical protein